MDNKKCINCHYFESERSYFKADKDGVRKFSAPCYITKDHHFEDDKCEDIKLFEYLKESK